MRGSYLHTPASAEQNACSKTSAAVKLRLCCAMLAQTAFTYCIPEAHSSKCALKQKIVYKECRCWPLLLSEFHCENQQCPKADDFGWDPEQMFGIQFVLKFWQPCSGLARAPCGTWSVSRRPCTVPPGV